jgi:hypothetical protein
MISDGNRSTHGTSLRRPFQFLSNLHMREGNQVKPPSISATLRPGNLAKMPSLTRLTSWVWNAWARLT